MRFDGVCAECGWWQRNVLQHQWELDRAASGEQAVIERTHWGICGYARQPGALMLTDYSDVETRENFACAMLILKENA